MVSNAQLIYFTHKVHNLLLSKCIYNDHKSKLNIDRGYLLSVLQVALSVAAEFWEQGDLERTVLEQQPIVRERLE